MKADGLRYADRNASPVPTRLHVLCILEPEAEKEGCLNEDDLIILTPKIKGQFCALDDTFFTLGYSLGVYIPSSGEQGLRYS